MNIEYLRRNADAWEWRAVRDGFGWKYKGFQLRREVEVRPHSVLSGYSDDDFRTEWRVSEGSESWNLFHWIMRLGWAGKKSLVSNV